MHPTFLASADLENIHALQYFYLCTFHLVGNGLRASIWPQVTERFQIARVVEFYGQSENPKGAIRPGGTANMWGKVGACGFIPNRIRAQPQQDAILLEYDFDSQR